MADKANKPEFEYKRGDPELHRKRYYSKESFVGDYLQDPDIAKLCSAKGREFHSLLVQMLVNRDHDDIATAYAWRRIKADARGGDRRPEDAQQQTQRWHETLALVSQRIDEWLAERKRKKIPEVDKGKIIEMAIPLDLPMAERYQLKNWLFERLRKHARPGVKRILQDKGLID